MKVQEIMTTDVRTCGPEATLAAAATIMWDNDCGAVPLVTSTGTCVGMITDRDICMALATQNRLASELTVGVVSAGKVVSCRADADIGTALELMKREQLRRLPVINGDGQLVGILSISDIIRHAKKGESKKGKHVPHKDVMRTLKALTKPAPPLDEDDTAKPGDTAATDEPQVASTAALDL
ncbi:MAG TPA: CBS domain-containing protein [Pyrinomonadaceae bacterium]|jgi:CBS domain-containing protein